MTAEVKNPRSDSRLARTAMWYAAGVIALAAVVAAGVIVWASLNTGDTCADADFTVCTDPARAILAFGPVLILLLGGLGAFVQTFRVWQAAGRWQIWHGTGWALFVLMVLYAGFAAGIAV